MTVRRAGSAFTMADASAALEAACTQIGVSSENASLIRLGENALFRLPHHRIVVRIARNADVLADAAKEVAVAAWLRDIGIPAAEPTDHAQPIVVLGHPVTLWRLIDDSGARPSLTDLAVILRQLHRAAVPPDLPLPQFSIFDRVSERITVAATLTESERHFLTGRLAELRRDYSAVKFTLPPGCGTR